MASGRLNTLTNSFVCGSAGNFKNMRLQPLPRDMNSWDCMPCRYSWFWIFLSVGEARLSPLYKKGPVLDPGNYRMLAVSGMLYRLYDNVLRDFVTSWCEAKKKIPDSQFGFYPRCNTQRPMFILRHLQHAAQATRPSNSPRLHAACIDLKQAYDTIPREALWDHLQRIRMPSSLLNIIKDLFMEPTANHAQSFGRVYQEERVVHQCC